MGTNKLKQQQRPHGTDQEEGASGEGLGGLWSDLGADLEVEVAQVEAAEAVGQNAKGVAAATKGGGCKAGS